MSRPMNPLAVFRSYAYHHILVACDGTETAEALARHGEITLFDHERAQRRYTPQTVPDGEGKYIVVINGMSDAAFYIQSASWSAVMVPREAPNGEQQFHTMISDGELVIKEPKGIRFYNLLNQIQKDLKTDANGICFLLKTVFVGHRDDGGTEIITNIRPHMFLMYDTSAIFDATGSEYTVSFVSITNGAARLPQMSSIVEGVTVKIEPGMSLLNAIGGYDESGKYQEGNLGSAINNHYDREWSKLKRSFECTNQGLQFEDQFRRVRYRFEVDPAYNSLTCGDNGPPSSEDTGDKDTIASYQGASASIENLIADIMRTSKEVVKQDNADAASGEKFMFKITSSVESNPNKFEVVYQVQRYKASVVKKSEWLTFSPGSDLGIEFDYIFTGQNVDVKSFDLKFQMGIVFFQVLNSYNNVPANTSSITRHTSPQRQTFNKGLLQGNSDQESTLKKPLFLGSCAKSVEFRNKRLAAGTQSYHSLMQRHAAVESLNARLVIHGNPQLLNESTLLPKSIVPFNPEPVPVVLTQQSERLPEGDRPRAIMPTLYNTPGYVKVNIKMPTLWQEDTGHADFAFPQDFAQDFWYTGWYFVTEIKNVFSEGEFSQELELVALIADDGETKVGKEEACPAEETSTAVGTKTGTAATETQPNVDEKDLKKRTISEVRRTRQARSAGSGGGF